MELKPGIFSNKNLKSLPKDLPEILENCLDCYNNYLTSFKGASKMIERYFFYGNNRLISFDFLPLKYMIIDA